ncbi:unnamed protein product [Moneuplotes crassus]|uniref:Uncharacterized protein n=1 Tax=Euplotes crassus TaxID=5936 RepID=A0AAD1XYA0_EUPCR|nr:unnamed protein product [Moneuplotes crassus]
MKEFLISTVQRRRSLAHKRARSVKNFRITSNSTLHRESLFSLGSVIRENRRSYGISKKIPDQPFKKYRKDFMNSSGDYTSEEIDEGCIATPPRPFDRKPMMTMKQLNQYGHLRRCRSVRSTYESQETVCSTERNRTPKAFNRTSTREANLKLRTLRYNEDNLCSPDASSVCSNETPKFSSEKCRWKNEFTFQEKQGISKLSI